MANRMLPYKIIYKCTDSEGTVRFQVVTNDENEDVITDAHGFGYTTIVAAHKAARYALRDKTLDNERKKIKQLCREWWKQHWSIKKCCLRFADEIAAGKWTKYDRFNLGLFRQILAVFHITDKNLKDVTTKQLYYHLYFKGR